MKTAMIELIEKIEHAISYNVECGLIDKYTWEQLSNDMYEALKKEKEQIINAHTNAYLIGEDDISVEDANEASIKYYNQTYNQ